MLYTLPKPTHDITAARAIPHALLMARLCHAASVALLLLLASTTSAFAEPVPPVEASGGERVHELRRTRGVASLRVAAALTALAREHSCRMAREDGFSHATGGSFRERVRAAGIPSRAIGENLAKIMTDAEPVQRAIDA